MHYNLDRLFRRREVSELCYQALASGPLSTRELAENIIQQKGFPGADRHLRTSIVYRIVQALRMQEKRGGKIVRVGKKANVMTWACRLAAPSS